MSKDTVGRSVRAPANPSVQRIEGGDRLGVGWGDRQPLTFAVRPL